MIRREFITLLGGTAAWPLAARAQQRVMPVLGYLTDRSADSDAPRLVAVRRGLADIGYAEGRNVAIEYGFTDGRYDRIRAMAADLVSSRVAVIVASDTAAALAVKAETATIPIVFMVGLDPVRTGLVTSMNRPGGNVTGVNALVSELSGKHLSLLRDLVPRAVTIAALRDSGSGVSSIVLADARNAATALGRKLLVLEAGTAEEIDAQFARLDQEPADAMLVPTTPFFVTRARQIAALATSHRIPAIYARREFAAEAGGLMSYGYNEAEAYRELGRYAGRILNGEKLADLPIIQPTKFELVINLKAAKAINFEFPPLVRALADEIIE
jgi:putative ABC transport system substrate-binding protein